MVWSCRELPNGRSNESAWVLSRTSDNETVAVTQRIDQVLRANGIIVEEMRPTGRDFDFCRSRTQ